MKRQHKKVIFKHSVFFQTFMTMSLMLLVLTIVFGGLMWNILKKLQSLQVERINRQMMEQTCGLNEYTFQMLTSEVNQIQWNKSVVSYFIRSAEIDSEAEIQIIQMLRAAAKENQMIHSIWIYRPDREWILSAEGYSGRRDDFQDRMILEKIIIRNPDSDEGHIYIPSNEAEEKGLDENIRLEWIDSRLFLLHDFILSHYIGSVCIEIDIDRLYDALNLSDDAGIFIFNKAGALIAPGQVKKADIPSAEIVNEGRTILPDAGQSKEEVGRECSEVKKLGLWYVVQGRRTGLYFFKRRQSDVVNYRWVMFPLLTGILFIISIGMIGAYMITYRIYEPINQLVNSVAGYREGRGGATDSVNELAYLRLSFCHAMDESSRMQRTMNYFEEDILEQVFKKILSGKSLEASGFYEIQEEWRIPWVSADYFRVITCQILVTDDVLEQKSASLELCHRSIRQIVHKRLTGSAFIVLKMESDMLAIVIAGKKNDNKDITQTGIGLVNEIKTMFSSNVVFHVNIVEGYLCSKLNDLEFAWKEECSQLRYNTYLKKSSGEIPDSDYMKLAIDSYYPGRAIQVFDLAVNNQRNSALKLMRETVNEMVHRAEKGLPDRNMQLQYELFRNTFIECCIQIPGWAASESVSSVSDSCLNDYIDSDDLVTYENKICEYFAGQINQIHELTQRKSYVYIDNAVQYIREKFTDSNMDIQMVADHLHITGNYFSELFNKQMKESFTSYLNKIRVENAQMLLKKTNMGIGEIGFRCGFTTVQHFNRMFKKYSGTTPRQFRDQVRREVKTESERREAGRT